VGGVPVPPVSESVYLREVDLAADTLLVANATASPVDISGWWLCNGPGAYVQLGSVSVPASGTVSVSGLALGDTAGAVGLYSVNGFTVAANMRAFAQWGASGSPRENVADAAGLWTSGTFVDVCAGHTKLLAVGDTTDASNGWSSQADPCALP
jgi:hypothetical protein